MSEVQRAICFWPTTTGEIRRLRMHCAFRFFFYFSVSLYLKSYHGMHVGVLVDVVNMEKLSLYCGDGCFELQSPKLFE